MRFFFLALASFISIVLFAPSPAMAIKKVAYPQIRVEAPAPYNGDAELTLMRKKLSDAIRTKSISNVSAFVGPGFFWTENGEDAEQYDKTRDALHNFKVAFGFRKYGKNADNHSGNDQLWDLLEDLVSEQDLYSQEDSPNIVCAPSTAEPVDGGAMDEAIENIEVEGENSEWVYSLGDITFTDSPNGSPVAKISSMALPVVSTYPPTRETGNNPIPTYYELLLPFGKTAWTEAKSVHALASDKLCYARDAGGAWKIAGFEQNN